MPVQLNPVFSGETANGEKVVLYQRGHEIHLKRPDGEIWVLDPYSIINTWPDYERSVIHIKIQSWVWTGEATGSIKALAEEPALVLEYKEETS